MKPIMKVLIVILAVTAVAVGIIFAQKRLVGRDSFNNLSTADLMSIVDTLPDNAKRQLAQNDQQRKSLLKDLKQIYSLAAAAQAEGLDKTDRFKEQLALQTDILLAGEQGKRAAQGGQGAPDPAQGMPGSISKEERDAYLASHAKEFDADLKTISAGAKKGPTPEEVETLKGQWAELKVRAEKARKAGLDKDPSMPLKLKLQRAQLLAQTYARSLKDKLKPSPEELKKYLDEHPEADMAKVKQKAEDLLARVKKGEDFAALAKEYSDDKSSAVNGGELGGWVTKGTWVPEFEQAAFSMKPGEISDLVKSNFGYHIIQVEDRRTVEKKADETKTAPATPDGKPAESGPHEEVKARHILISTREVDGVEDMLTQKKVERALDDAKLKYPVNAPEDFTINAPGVQPNQGLRLPGMGSGSGGHMAPIEPNKNK